MCSTPVVMGCSPLARKYRVVDFPQAVGVILLLQSRQQRARDGSYGARPEDQHWPLRVAVGEYTNVFVKLLRAGGIAGHGAGRRRPDLRRHRIVTLQTAMEGFSGAFKPSELSSSGWLRQGSAVVIGLTVVLQSPSAAVATALIALHTASGPVFWESRLQFKECATSFDRTP